METKFLDLLCSQELASDKSNLIIETQKQEITTVKEKDEKLETPTSSQAIIPIETEKQETTIV